MRHNCIIYLSENNRINFQDLNVKETDTEFYYYCDLQEKCIIAGLILDGYHVNVEDLTEIEHDLTPIEMYLIRSSNLRFLVPDRIYRQYGNSVNFVKRK